MSQNKSENKKKPSYGNWPSSITAEVIVSDSISIDEPRLTSDSIYYIERRPQENGRCVIVRYCENKFHDVLPSPYSARSRVHEYGGGSYFVHNNIVFFVNDSDQDIYCVKDNQIERVTTSGKSRFADFVYDASHHRLIAICETHEGNSVINSIVSIDVGNGDITTVVQGNDFYASPRLNSAADRLCWQSWNGTTMPWDGNRLYLAQLDSNGHIKSYEHIAGGENISVFQPQWSPDDILYYISDDTGWWHLYRYIETASESQIEQLTRGDKEFGLPQWVFAQSTYTFINKSRILCCYQSDGETTLATLSVGKQPELTKITTPWNEFSAISSAANADNSNNSLCFIASSGEEFPQLIAATFNKSQPHKLNTSVLKTSCTLPVTNDYYSQAQTILFTNRHNQKVYANYYPPTNPDIQQRTDELPPMVVICHGGPTGQSMKSLDPKKQFWTSRGFALLDVNYSGSTGYGREYRERLNGKWGLLDVEDCCDAALYAVSQGLADANRLIIRGSSAGGYTVLSALTYHQVFSAGASYYGISELSCLATDSHKFEAHYFDQLIGPYPEAEALYTQRSPVYHSEKLNCPVIFFQGIDDRVVPKEQAEKMFHALEEKGMIVAAQYFPGEQHGFRRAETIIQSLTNELSFYQLVFKLKPEDEIRFTGSLQIKNI
jgi:dipeptidyl aminopeptidase/acylaminoacyl peptidase